MCLLDGINQHLENAEMAADLGFTFSVAKCWTAGKTGLVGNIPVTLAPCGLAFSPTDDIPIPYREQSFLPPTSVASGFSRTTGAPQHY